MVVSGLSLIQKAVARQAPVDAALWGVALIIQSGGRSDPVIMQGPAVQEGLRDAVELYREFVAQFNVETLNFISRGLAAISDLPVRRRVAVRTGLLDLGAWANLVLSLGVPAANSGRDPLESLFDCYSIVHSMTAPLKPREIHFFGERYGAALRRLLSFAGRVHSLGVFNLQGLPVFTRTGMEKFVYSPDLAQVVARLELPALAVIPAEDVVAWNLELVNQTHDDLVRLISDHLVKYPVALQAVTAIDALVEAGFLFSLGQPQHHCKALTHLRRALHAAFALNPAIPELVPALRGEFYRLATLAWQGVSRHASHVKGVTQIAVKVFTPVLFLGNGTATDFAWVTAGVSGLRQDLVATVVALRRLAGLSETETDHVKAIIDVFKHLEPLSLPLAL